MIARRVKPGLIEIVNEDFVNEVESYTLLNVSHEDALRLLYSSENITKDGNKFVITYQDSDLVSRMYKAIANKHSKDNANFLDVSKKYQGDDTKIPGTSILWRDPNTHVIRVAYRKTSKNNKECSINRLFVTNEIRDKFFKDVVRGKRYLNTNKYELDTQDLDMYTKWSDYMNERYFELIKEN